METVINFQAINDTRLMQLLTLMHSYFHATGFNQACRDYTAKGFERENSSAK